MSVLDFIQIVVYYAISSEVKKTYKVTGLDGVGRMDSQCLNPVSLPSMYSLFVPFFLSLSVTPCLFHSVCLSVCLSDFQC